MLSRVIIMFSPLTSASKKIMTDAGVPVTPGYWGDDQTPSVLAREAEKIG